MTTLRLIPILLITVLYLSISIQSVPGQQPKKIAFLVGINDYFKKNLEDLKYCENDVTVVARQLKTLGFETTLLTGRDATRGKIQKELAAFIEKASKLESNDIVFAMFSGHGQQLPVLLEKKIFVDGKPRLTKRIEEAPFYCARDAIPFDPKNHTVRGKTESQVAEEFNLIPINQLIGQLDEDSNSLRNLLVVDACRNNPSKGAKTANISGNTIRELPTGLSILFSAKSGQKSWESADPKIKHGVMSHFLVEGLNGKAVDELGEYTWGDLTNYVKKNVIRNRGKLAGAADRLQNPHTINSGSDVIVLGRLMVPKLVAPFGKTEITTATAALLRIKDMKPVLKNDLGMEFRLIPPGKFMMGSPASEKDRDKFEHQHEVEITKPFYMGTYEVTQSQWKKVTGNNPSTWQKGQGAKFTILDFETPNYPVESVTWDDVQSFIKRLNKEHGVTGFRFRLPTEAEWEYACRAGTETPFHFGEILTGKGANCYGKRPYGSSRTGPDIGHPTNVGKYQANAFGLHDMSGNVSEWCLDWSSSSYYLKSPSADPTGPTSGTSRVLRGGDYSSFPKNCRSASRSGNRPDYLWTNVGPAVGFRLVLAR